MSWIDDFLQIVSEHTDAPEVIIKGSAYWLISATIGPFFQVLESRRPLRPNLFMVFCGPAGLTRKSTVLEYAKSVYEIAWRKYYDEFDIDISVEDKFIEEFSVEGIADYIDEHKDIKDFVLMTDEFGVWLKRSEGQRYMFGARGMLSKLYYGESYKQVLSKRSAHKNVRKIPRGLYFTMLCGMQEPDLYLTEADVRQGLVRRTFFINISIKDLKKYLPPLEPKMRFIQDELYKLGEEIGDRMIKVREMIEDFGPDYKIDVIFDSKLRDAINERAEELHKLCLEKYLNKDGGYLDSSWEHLLKLTLLEGLADSELEPIMVAGEPILELKDMEYYDKALMYFDWVVARVLDMIVEVSTPKQRTPLRLVSDIEDKIKHVLVSSGGYINRRELARKVRIDNTQLRDVLINMLEKEDIGCIRVKVSVGRGAKWTMIFYDPSKKKVIEDYVSGKEYIEVNSRLLKDLW